MSAKQVAEDQVKKAWDRLCAQKDALDSFAKICKEAHDLGVSDGQIVKLIQHGYSRSRIQQFRTGKTSTKKEPE